MYQHTKIAYFQWKMLHGLLLYQLQPGNRASNRINLSFNHLIYDSTRIHKYLKLNCFFKQLRKFLGNHNGCVCKTKAVYHIICISFTCASYLRYNWAKFQYCASYILSFGKEESMSETIKSWFWRKIHDWKDCLLMIKNVFGK